LGDFNANFSESGKGAGGKGSHNGRIRFKEILEKQISRDGGGTKSCARQHSRLTWMRKGDSNTRFFHLHANMRKKKSFIVTLTREAGTTITEENKLALAHSHFSNLLGTSSFRTWAINWKELGYEQHDVEDLDAPFTAQEIEAVIKDMPSEKAPGLDGFIGFVSLRNVGRSSRWT